MKIKKIYQGTVPENKILNAHSESQTDVYSCDYMNTYQSVINLSSEDSSNPIVLFNLDEGIYKLYGYVKYYPTYEGTAALTSPTLVTVQKSSTTTYIQMLEPYGNKVTGYEITETNYIETKIETKKYSTEEIKVGTYADGKPIYQKSFIGEYPSGHTLLNNVDNIVSCDGTVTISGVKRLVPYYEYYSSKEYCATISVNSSNVVTRYVLGGTAVTSGAFTNLTIEYTKTTD